MSKWHGRIGYGKQEETSPGVFEEKIVTHLHSGDILNERISNSQSNKINDDITISNRISVISNPFINNNIPFIRYVEYMGCKWKVTNCDIQYPRIILTMGGIYHE